jgi:TonB family protein
MQPTDRPNWLRRDGAPLAVSLLLHLALLLMLAPWLVMRTMPAPQVAVEVQLEPQKETHDRQHPDKAVKLKSVRKSERQKTDQPVKRVPVVKPASLQAQLEALQREPRSRIRKYRGARGRQSAARRAAASLSLPKVGAMSSVEPGSSADSGKQSQGMAALGRSATTPSLSAPSAGAAPQPSAAASPLPPRPGEDRQDGTVNLAGAVPQVQAQNPEFRQAARMGGTETLRGGGRPPEEGLARQPGSLNQVALQAAAAVPQSIPGANSASGRSAAVSGTRAGAGERSTAMGEGAASLGKASGAGALGNTGTVNTGTANAVAGSGNGASGAGSNNAGRNSGVGSATPGERGTGLQTAGAATTGASPTGSGGARGDGMGRADRGDARGSAATEGRDTSGVQARAEPGTSAAAREGATAQLNGGGQMRASAQALNEPPQGALQAQPVRGTARVIEERFTAVALKVDTPRSICELPLMFAGFDRRPIPSGLDHINASAAALAGETPPRHRPDNQSPRYPVQALGSRAEGRVVVRAEVRPDGEIGRSWVKQSSGVAVLDQAALATVQQWHFYPAERHGLVVAMWLDVPIEYKAP